MPTWLEQSQEVSPALRARTSYRGRSLFVSIELLSHRWCAVLRELTGTPIMSQYGHKRSQTQAESAARLCRPWYTTRQPLRIEALRE